MNAQYCNATNAFAGAEAWTFKREGSRALEAPVAPRVQKRAAPAFAGVRELASLSSPWLFGAVPADNASFFSASWAAAFDPQGLLGAAGLRTAELRHPRFSCPPSSCCWWSGPSWPFETSKLLRAAADVLQTPALAAQVPQLNRSGAWLLLAQYTAMHSFGAAGAGAWTIINASGADPTAPANPAVLAAEGLLFDGLASSWITWGGATPDWSLWSADGAAPSVSLAPLQPSDAALPWWCLDGVRVGGRILSVFFDADGARYGRGAGLSVLLDGALAAHAATTQGPALTVLL